MLLHNESTVIAIYSMLRKLPPFNKWNLPLASQIQFIVEEDEECMGEFDVKPLRIKVSTATQEHFENVVRTLCHELVHMKLYLDGKANYHHHDKTFKKHTEQIANVFGYDKKEL
jgi:hypothetical protein